MAAAAAAASPSIVVEHDEDGGGSEEDLPQWVRWPYPPEYSCIIPEWTPEHAATVQRAVKAGYLTQCPAADAVPAAQENFERDMQKMAAAFQTTKVWVRVVSRSEVAVTIASYNPAVHATESARHEARFKGRWYSTASLWRTDPAKFFADAVRWKGGRISTRSLRTSAWYIGGRVPNFPPVVAAGIMRILQPSSVFDPSSGWGDRACAALALPHVKRYIGYDCNPALAPGMARIMSAAALFGKDPDAFLWRCCTSEDGPRPTCPEDAVDLVFTSPPFCDLEEYEPDAAVSQQSSCLYPTQEAWMRDFWPRYVDTCLAWLRPGGKLVFHMANSKRTDTVWLAQAQGVIDARPDTRTLDPFIVRLNGRGLYPMYAWEKLG